MHKNITKQPEYLAEQQTVHEINLALRTNNLGHLTTALAQMHENYSRPMDRMRILIAAEIGIPDSALLRRVVDRKIGAEEPVVRRDHSPIRRVALDVSPRQKPGFPSLSRS